MGSPHPRGDVPSMARGFTLLEMTVAVSIAALALATGIPAARRSLDRMAVVGAREALVGMLVRTRSEAVARGGATLVLDETRGTVRAEAGEVRLDSLSLSRDFGVRLDVGGSSAEARIRFDGLGIGRIASRTVWMRRGAAAAEVVISSYGRVDRR